MSKALLKTLGDLTDKIKSMTKRNFFIVNQDQSVTDDRIDEIFRDNDGLDVEIAVLNIDWSRIDEV